MHLKPSIYLISGKNPLFSKSGYASYSYNLAKLLTSLNYQVDIFCLGEKDQVLKTNIGIIHITGSNPYSNILKGVEMAGLIFLAPKLALSLGNVIANKVILWGIGPWSLAGVLIKLLPGKRVIVISDYFTTIKHEFLGTLSGITIKDHGLWNKIKVWIGYLTIVQFYTILEFFLLKFSDKIITHYHSTETILTSQFGILSKKYTRLPYYIELPKRQTSHFPFPTSHFILLVSRHDGRKGINFLLHAFSILNTRGISYTAVIIGGGRLFQTHLKLAQKLKLTNVHLLGYVTHLQPFLKKADLFVCPSVEEGSSSLAILEAMQSSLPIVSTNIDGILEDLTHQQSALLVPAKNPVALADAMQKLLENPHLAKKLGQNAKKAYQKKYNLVKVKRELLSFLQKQESI